MAGPWESQSRRDFQHLQDSDNVDNGTNTGTPVVPVPNSQRPREPQFYSPNFSNTEQNPAPNLQDIPSNGTTQHYHKLNAEPPAKLRRASRLGQYNICYPPYNLLGPLSHVHPEVFEKYCQETSQNRQIIHYNADVFRKHNVPSAWQSAVRGHAQKPTCTTFCEYEVTRNLMFVKNKSTDPSPISISNGLYAEDGVYGLLIKWASVKDASWFLYYHFKQGLLQPVGGLDKAVIMPPRFVDDEAELIPHMATDLSIYTEADADTFIDYFAARTPQNPSAFHDASSRYGQFSFLDAKMFYQNQSWKYLPTGSVESSLKGLRFLELPDFFSEYKPAASVGPNGISISRIAAGQEVRTTLMVRNLPAQVKYADVIDFLDKVCFGKYDFAYLRHDFTTGNNVGYFFVNFQSPEVVIHFVLYVEGRPMPGWEHTRKSIQLAFADNQGSDSLSDRFRNSAIMQEPYEYRPHLFYTFEDAEKMGVAIAGMEKPFPPPNNLTRLDRSIARTKAEGLFVGGSRNNRGSRANSTAAPRDNTATEIEQLHNLITKYTHSDRRGALLRWISDGGF